MRCPRKYATTIRVHEYLANQSLAIGSRRMNLDYNDGNNAYEIWNLMSYETTISIKQLFAGIRSKFSPLWFEIFIMIKCRLLDFSHVTPTFNVPRSSNFHVSDLQVELAKLLLSEGQDHLFDHWSDPGVDDGRKISFFDQVCFVSNLYIICVSIFLENKWRLLKMNFVWRDHFFCPLFP